MKGQFLTLDFDDEHIRVLEIKGGRIQKWAEAPISRGWVQNGVIVNAVALGGAIRMLLASQDIRTKMVIGSISGIRSVNRYVLVTGRSEMQIETAIREKARQEMPVPLEELYISWHTVSVAGDQRQVLVTGTPRDLVGKYFETLKTAGLVPSALDMKTVALARLVNDGQALVANVEPHNIDVAYVSGAVPTIAYSTDYESGLSGSKLADKVARAIDTLSAYNDSLRPESPIDPKADLVLSGQADSEPGLAAAVAELTGYSLRQVATNSEYPEGLPVNGYSANLGLASRMAPRGGKGKPISSREANVLPSVRRTRSQMAKQIGYPLLLLGLFLFLVPFYQKTTTAIDETSKLRAQAEILDQRLTLRQIEINRRDKMAGLLQEYEAISRKLGTYILDLNIVYDEAERLGLQVTAVTHLGKKITISTETIGYPPFDEYRKIYEAYVQALMKKGNYVSVEHSPLSFPPGGKVDVVAQPRN
ncbi:MAG: pilus assembly protein PilM [Chloroflexi bacterium]|nr:pilus assembly protein PilM [Chloroflexota bacterium]